MYIIAIPFTQTFDDKGLLYKLPLHLETEILLWSIVSVPLKSHIVLGVVGKIMNKIDNNIEEKKIREVKNIENNHIFLNKKNRELVFWISSYYFTPIHNALNLFFPKNLKEKIKKNTINKQREKKAPPFKYIYTNKVILSEAQQKVLTQIYTSIHNKFYLYGLTGSGKTQIYIELMKHNIDKWKQILYLIPEIILLDQIAARLKKVFWNHLIEINSAISDAQKTKNWIEIQNGNAKIILWTRSALFYPFSNLWLIIIDEEHDSSYISDSRVRYNTREVAEKMTRLHNNTLLLWSGTPSVYTLYKALKWEYELLYLLEKYS